jgi:hypothetical protein
LRTTESEWKAYRMVLFKPWFALPSGVVGDESG